MGMRLSHALKSVRFTPRSAVTQLFGGTALLGVALFVANCGQDQVAGPDGPSRLVFTTEPNAAIAGASIAPAVRVEARDAENKLSSSYTGAVTVALGTNAGGGTLSGTLTVNAVGGVASFDDLSINKSGNGYTLSASAPRLTAAASDPFDISAGPASKLVYSVEPTSGSAGTAMALEIEAWDAHDNLDTDFTGDVTVAITSGTGTSGATLSGTASAAAVAGVAAFTGLSIDKAGTGYTLDATSGSLTAATSASFDVNAGAASKLAFTLEPTSAAAGAPMTVAVSATDVNGPSQAWRPSTT
jgi:hypothetical protein